jgi:hypothetical protein
MKIDDVACISLAYRWEMAPPGEQSFDVILALASTIADVTRVAPPKAGHPWQSAVDTAVRASFAFKHPPGPAEEHDVDVSGLLGLLGAMQGEQGRHRANAFERLVADSMLRMMVEALGAVTPDRRPVVLLQGPMLPKLRGRLYYRGLDPELPILCLTYQPEWLCRLPETAAVPGSRGQPIAGLRWEGPLPPLPIDRGSRSFVGRGPNGSYHVEIPANNWDPATGEEWWATRRSMCELICDESIQMPNSAKPQAGVPEEVDVPWPLGAAGVAAQQQLDHTCQGERAIAEFMAWCRRQASPGPAPRKARERSPEEEACAELWGEEVCLKVAARPAHFPRPPTVDPVEIRKAAMEALGKHGRKSKLLKLGSHSDSAA